LNEQQLFEEFRGLLQEEFSLPEDRITLDSRLVDDLDLDSLDFVAASLAVEDKWGVKMEDEDLAEIKTVRDVVDYMSARLGAQS
jgi:acyl carrier protein